MLKLIRTVHGQSLWVALVAILTTTPASADETFDFSLAAQPLQEALVEFSRTTRRQVSADSVYIEGLESNQVSGRLAPDQALGQMIAGTGLNLVTVNNRSFALRPAATVAAASTTAGASGSARIVEEMIVQGQRVSAFRVADTSTASLFDMPIEETPFNVGVVTQELIADQQIFTLEEAVKNSASVNASRTHSRNAPSYSIRGFGLNSDRSGFLINGVPIAGGNAPPAHVSALERIEVLKGSTALFYGAGEPAGVINYVYKTPQADSAYAVSATIGQFDDYRVELDATGQVGTEKLLYRFTLGWQDSQGAINYDYNETVAPTLQLLWNISDRTSLRFIGEYVSTETNPMQSNAIFIDDEFADLPRENYYGFSNDVDKLESGGVQAHLEHEFSEQLRVKAQVGWNTGGRETNNSGYIFFLPLVLPGFNDPENGIAPRSVFDQRRDAESEYAAVHFAYDVGNDFWSHQLVAGLNYSQSETENVGYFVSPLQAFAGGLSSLAGLPPSVNVFDPVTVPFDHLSNFDDSPPFYRQIFGFEDVGLNLQDAIDIPSLNLHLLLGVRYSRAESNSVLNLDENGAPVPGNPDVSEDAWVPRVGIVYDLPANHSIYASYGESFLPPLGNAIDASGQIITTPETGSQYEIGWRGSFFSGRLATTLAAYDLRKKNIITPTVDPQVSEITGEQLSRGVEFDATGQISEYWDIYLSYAYTDTETVDGGTTSIENGERRPGIPLHRAVLWNNVSMGWAGLEGLRVSYGLDYGSEVVTGVPNLATLGLVNAPVDGQGLVHNANISYSTLTRMGDWRFNLGIRNITDERYVVPTVSAIGAIFGQPRTVLLTATVSF